MSRFFLYNNRFLITKSSKYDIDDIHSIHDKEFPGEWKKEIFEEFFLCKEILSFSVKSIYNRKIIGFIIARFFKEESEIFSIVVDANYRKQGIGSFLIEFLLKDLYNEKGVNVVFLEVDILNITAQILYKKFGFLKIGLRKNYYIINNKRSDALILRHLKY